MSMVEGEEVECKAKAAGKNGKEQNAYCMPGESCILPFTTFLSFPGH